jgi:MHS family alpha-ketoglutarate permease-like MFS transporter
VSTAAVAGAFPQHADAFDAADTRRRVKAILLGSMGNLIEWYDVYAYAAFALYFASSFFPNSDPVAQQLSAAAIFAAGFVARPFGGSSSAICRRHGRRNAQPVSALMCFGSLLIANRRPGPSASARRCSSPSPACCGISQGRRYGTSATYLSESRTPTPWLLFRRQYALIGGQLCAIAAARAARSS